MDFKLANNLEDLEKLFSSRMNEYDAKLQKIASGTAPPHADLASLSSEFNDFKSFVCLTLSKLKTQLELLTLGLDKHETIMRGKVLLFHGIPEKPNENLQDSVIKVLANQMKISDIGPQHIKVCHRLGSTPGKIRPTLVRFYNMEQRHIVWENKTALKSTGITLSEFLTRTRHRVFTDARKHFGVKNCWTLEGRIVILTPNQSRQKIESMSELVTLMKQYPSAAGESAPAVEDSPVQKTKATAKTTKNSRRRM